MRTAFKIFILLCLGTAAWTAVFTAEAEAQPVPYSSTFRQSGHDRSGTWEFYLPFAYMDNTTVDGDGGSSSRLDDDFSWGFGFGYNFNNSFSLGFDILYGSAGYDSTVVEDGGTTVNVSGTLETFSGMLNATYYLPLSRVLTPFVTGGAGLTTVDTNIPSGPPSGVCWWDPWYGYICTSSTPTHYERSFSYSAGIGLRWNISRNFALRGGYHKKWIDFEESGTSDFDFWRLDFVFGQ
jgi:opacity protein-like surface antigen